MSEGLSVFQQTDAEQLAAEYGFGAEGLLHRWRLYQECVEPPDQRMDYYMDAYDHLGCERGDTIVDVGCLDGYSLFRFRLEREHSGLLYGVDPNINTVGLSAAFNQILMNMGLDPIRLQTAKGEDIPLGDSSVDVGMEFFATYHGDPAQMIDELIRVTRPGGDIVIATSGRDNKLEHRKFEDAIAHFLRSLTGQSILPPEPFTKRFDAEIAEVMLPAFPGLQVVDTMTQNGSIRITPGDKYRYYLESLASMRHHFSQPISRDNWQLAIENVVQPVVQAAFDRQGYFDDQLRRAIIFCKNTK